MSPSRERLDSAAIYAAYSGDKGQPPTDWAPDDRPLKTALRAKLGGRVPTVTKTLDGLAREGLMIRVKCRPVILTVRAHR